MVTRMKTGAALAALTASLLCADGASATLINGDFETGDFSDWTQFTTSNGTTGTPVVTSFDVTGGGASLAARFQVGNLSNPGNSGGGIYQSVNVGAGVFSVSADIAAFDSTAFNGSNSDWGLFELLVNNVVVDSHDFGSPACCDAVRSSLSYNDTVAGGTYEVRFRMRRDFTISGGVGATPFQYIDNVVVNAQAVNDVPEPGTLALLGVALAAAGYRRRRA